jgi:hypothetical protein
MMKERQEKENNGRDNGDHANAACGCGVQLMVFAHQSENSAESHVRDRDDKRILKAQNEAMREQQPSSPHVPLKHPYPRDLG